MKVLVTGGAGFLGKAVMRHLEDGGHEAFAVRHDEYDLLDRYDIMAALTMRPEVVVHLAAAVGGIGANQAHPGRFLYENAVMGLDLMEMSRTSGVRKFVTIGTACEYPEHAPLPLSEGSIWDGYPAPVTAPYGLAKRLLLAAGQAYRQEYGFDVIHLIPGNLYGPGDNFDEETGHVIPGLIRRFSEATWNDAPEVRCWGSGFVTREFVYVEDAARAIVMAMERYEDPEPVNIGSGEEVLISNLAQRIAALYGYEGKITWDESRPDGVARRLLDPCRAEAFGFTAEVTLHEGLSETVEWYEGTR